MSHAPYPPGPVQCTGEHRLPMQANDEVNP